MRTADLCTKGVTMNTLSKTFELTDLNGADHEVEITFDVYVEPQTWDEPGGTYTENVYIAVDGEDVTHAEFAEMFSEEIDTLIDSAISNYSEPEPQYDDCDERGHFVN